MRDLMQKFRENVLVEYKKTTEVLYQFIAKECENKRYDFSEPLSICYVDSDNVNLVSAELYSIEIGEYDELIFNGEDEFGECELSEDDFGMDNIVYIISEIKEELKSIPENVTDVLQLNISQICYLMNYDSNDMSILEMDAINLHMDYLTKSNNCVRYVIDVKNPSHPEISINSIHGLIDDNFPVTITFFKK